MSTLFATEKHPEAHGCLQGGQWRHCHLVMKPPYPEGVESIYVTLSKQKKSDDGGHNRNNSAHLLKTPKVASFGASQFYSNSLVFLNVYSTQIRMTLVLCFASC